jgi:hypothetical protein
MVLIMCSVGILQLEMALIMCSAGMLRLDRINRINNVFCQHSSHTGGINTVLMAYLTYRLY